MERLLTVAHASRSADWSYRDAKMSDKQSSDGTGQVLKQALQGVAQEFAEDSKGTGKELAKAGQTMAKTLNVLLTPFSGLVWGYERVEEYLRAALAERLQDVPEERLVPPPINVAGSAIDAMRFTGDVDELREMFANLVAWSMDSETASDAHPSFVEIIKQLSADEARIMRFLGERWVSYGVITYPVVHLRRDEKERPGAFFLVMRNFSDLGEKAKCQDPNGIQVYLDNLCRLELCRLQGNALASGERYSSLESHEFPKQVMENIDKDKYNARIERDHILITEYGFAFIKACVNPRKLEEPVDPSM